MDDFDQRLDKLLDYYYDLARKKGYREETIELGWMFACTVKFVNKYGDEEKALKEIVKLCEKYDDGKEFIAEVGSLIGV